MADIFYYFLNAFTCVDYHKCSKKLEMGLTDDKREREKKKRKNAKWKWKNFNSETTENEKNVGKLSNR